MSPEGASRFCHTLSIPITKNEKGECVPKVKEENRAQPVKCQNTNLIVTAGPLLQTPVSEHI